MPTSPSTSGSDGKLAEVGVAQEDGVSPPPLRSVGPPSSLCQDELPVPRASAKQKKHLNVNFYFKIASEDIYLRVFTYIYDGKGQ